MKTKNLEYQKNIAFTDAEGKSVFVEIIISNGRLSMTGNITGYGAGQIVDSIKPATQDQGELIAVWRKWHLNDMRAGTAKQMKVIDGLNYDEALRALISHDKEGNPMEPEAIKGALEIWERLNKCVTELDYFNLVASLGVNEFVLLKDQKIPVRERAEKFLFGETLLFDDGYRYGSAWLKEELHPYIIEQLESITQAIGGEFEGSSYQKQANDFLESIGATFKATFSHYGKYFQDDKESRDVYNIVFERSGRFPLTLTFGQSIAHSGKFIVMDRGVNKFNTKEQAKKFMFQMHLTGQPEKNKDFAEPSAYDILACITKNDPGTLEDFCSEFGYDPDSKKVEKIYLAVCDEWRKVISFFSPTEVEQLQNIQ